MRLEAIMKLLKVVSLFLCFHQSFSMNISDGLKIEEKWKTLAEVVKPIIKTSGSRRLNINEVTLVDFSTDQDASQFVKILNEDGDIVINSVLRKMGPFKGKTPDYVIVLQDKFDKVFINN